MKKPLLFFAFSLVFCITLFAQNEPKMWTASGAKNMGFKAKISYGDYSTSRINSRKTHTTSTSIFRANVKEENTIEYKFTQKYGNLEAKVYMLKDCLPENEKIVYQLFNIKADEQIPYMGTIDLPDGNNYQYSFNLARQDSDFVSGYIIDSNNEAFATMVGNNTTSYKDRMLMRFFCHYDFIINDKVVAKVNSDGDGTAWIDPSLDDNTKLILASCITSILVQKWHIEQ